MKKYVVFAGVGLVGCDTVELVEVPDSIQHVVIFMDKVSRQIAIENAESFGYYRDEDYFGDEVSLGCDWDDTIGYYMCEGFLDYYYEGYNPEKHDNLLIS